MNTPFIDKKDFLADCEPYVHERHGYVRLPSIEVDLEKRKKLGVAADASNLEVLKAIARIGYKDKTPKDADKKLYQDRAKMELETIEKLGFVDYFLLVWKEVTWADEQGIARGFGRGSCAGSLIMYYIGVTNYVDPIKYGLFFERFISETRAKSKVIDGEFHVFGELCPDVDLDFEQARRGEVIQHLKDSYPGRVCKIATASTLSGKVLIKEVGKIVGNKSEEEMKIVSDMLPKIFGIVSDIEEAHDGVKEKDSDKFKIEPVKEFQRWCKDNPQVYKVALGLRDLLKNRSAHPSGFVVSYALLEDYIPVEYSIKDESEEKELISAFDMKDIAQMSVKLDILGVRCCSVVSDVLNNIDEKVQDINLDSDPIIYDNLQNLKTPHGLFQIEAPTNLKVCREIKPKNLSELSDVLAIARPGALSFLPKYVKNEKESIHPLFDKVLEPTRGISIFQETMMQLAVAVGFTLNEAETLRRIVGKKDVQAVKEWKEKIEKKVSENNLPVELSDLLWKILEDSASYSFNKCADENSLVYTENGEKPLKDVQIDDWIACYDTKSQKKVFNRVKDKATNFKPLFEVEFENGKKIKVSKDHKFICQDGVKRNFQEILDADARVICERL